MEAELEKDYGKYVELKTMHRTYTISYTVDKNDGGYSGQCVELPAAISQGETLDELMHNMIDAINLVLESMDD